MKKAVSYVLTLAMLLSLCAMSAFAAPAPEPELAEPFQPQSFTVVTGDIVEHFYINENREVFVNGRNITTITPITFPSPNGIVPFADDEEWIYLMEQSYEYDLGGLTIAGAAKLLKAVDIVIELSFWQAQLGSFLVNGFIQAGVSVQDIQTIYYKNLNQSRPDMRFDHSIYLNAKMHNEQILHKHLIDFTTYA